MRRSNTSRRTNRTLVPSRSAACSTVNSLSNSGGLPACGGSCSGSGRSGQLLPGDPAPFPCTGGGRQGQPPLPLGGVAGPDEHPGGDHDDGLVVLGPAPGVQGYAVAGPAVLGEGDPATSSFVGDSTSDVQSAKAAGTHSVGYANKPGKIERLQCAGAEVIVTTMAELRDALLTNLPSS